MDDASPEFLQNLTIHPFHPKLLYLYITILQKQLNNCLNKECKTKTLSTIKHYASILLQNDRYNFIPYKILGETLFHLNQPKEAAELLSKALHIESFQPVVSFDTVPITFCPSDY